MKMFSIHRLMAVLALGAALFATSPILGFGSAARAAVFPNPPNSTLIDLGIAQERIMQTDDETVARAGDQIIGTHDGGKTFDRDGTEHGAGFAMTVGNSGASTLDALASPPPGENTEAALTDGFAITKPDRRMVPAGDTPKGFQKAMSHATIPSGSEPTNFDPATGRTIRT